MGREVTCVCRWGDEVVTVKAILEAEEVIFRGNIKRRVGRSEISKAQVINESLHFTVGGDRVVLQMTVPEATAWLKKLKSPAPSLRDKLGLSTGCKTLVINRITDTALDQALRGVTTSLPSDAGMLVAVALDDQQLAAAVTAHRQLASDAPLWIIHRKGRDATFSAARVRESMRSRGFIDSKVAAVSTTLTASRYSKIKQG